MRVRLAGALLGLALAFGGATEAVAAPQQTATVLQVTVVQGSTQSTTVQAAPRLAPDYVDKYKSRRRRRHNGFIGNIVGSTVVAAIGLLLLVAIVLLVIRRLRRR